jgi:hypothetical protein
MAKKAVENGGCHQRKRKSKMKPNLKKNQWRNVENGNNNNQHRAAAVLWRKRANISALHIAHNNAWRAWRRCVNGIASRKPFYQRHQRGIDIAARGASSWRSGARRVGNL